MTHEHIIILTETILIFGFLFSRAIAFLIKINNNKVKSKNHLKFMS